MRHHILRAVRPATGLAVWIAPRVAYAQGVESAAGAAGRGLLTFAALLVSLAASSVAIASGLGHIRYRIAIAFELVAMLLFAVWLTAWRTYVLWSTWFGAALTVVAALSGVILYRFRVHA